VKKKKIERKGEWIVGGARERGTER